MAGGDKLQAFAKNRAGKHRRGGGAVTGDVRGFARDFFDHLSAHVLEFVFELDFFGHRDAVFGNRRRAPRLLQTDIASFGA